MVQRPWLVVGVIAIAAIVGFFVFKGAFGPAIQPSLEDLEAELALDNLEPGTVLTSPVTITGEAKRGWFNEQGEMVAELFDDNGTLLWSGLAVSEGDSGWGGDSFTTTIEFATPVTERGMLRFTRSNSVEGYGGSFTHAVTVLFVEPEEQQ